MEQFVRRALARAEEVGNRRALGLCCHALGAVLYLRGEWPECMAALQRSIDLARSYGGVFGQVLGAQRLALLETALGRHDAAHGRLRDALAQARASDNALVHGHGIGRILASLAHNRFQAGDLAQATQYLAEGYAAQQATGECPSCDVLLYPAAVPIAVVLGDLAQAEHACRKAEETAAAFGSRAWTASAHELRGRVAAARGDRPAAAGCFEAACDLFESLGQPYDVARCLEALASLGDSTAAGARARAAAIYAGLGATADLRRLERG